MNKSLRSCMQIAIDVDLALQEKDVTLEQCVYEYNQIFRDDIRNHRRPALNKDFVQRVRKGNFKVISDRIADLCCFLDIDPYEQGAGRVLLPELKNIENLIQRYPGVAEQLADILNNLCRLTEVGLLEGADASLKARHTS